MLDQYQAQIDSALRSCISVGFETVVLLHLLHQKNNYNYNNLDRWWRITVTDSIVLLWTIVIYYNLNSYLNEQEFIGIGGIGTVDRQSSSFDEDKSNVYDNGKLSKQK